MDAKFEAKFDSAKRFWNRNKGKLAVVATGASIGLYAITRSNAKTVQGFLDANDLNVKFWEHIGATPEEIEEWLASQK